MVKGVRQNTEKALINNVNVIDFRALSPGMRHIARHNQQFMRKPMHPTSDGNPRGGMRNSPTHESSNPRHGAAGDKGSGSPLHEDLGA